VPPPPPPPTAVINHVPLYGKVYVWLEVIMVVVAAGEVVTELLAALAALVPAEFVAVTVNV
jgi:hypothetical protein